MSVRNRSISEDIRAYKRDAILDVALELFFERGYVGTTVDAVAERLSVSKPFIYSYFRSKGDILIAVYETLMNKIIALLDEAIDLDGPPSERFRKFIYEFSKENMQSQMIASVFLQEEKHLDASYVASIRRRQGEFDSKLRDLIQEGIKSGEFDVPDASLAAMGVTGMVRWIQRWYRPDGRYSVDYIATMFSDMALRAVGFTGAMGMPEVLAKSGDGDA